MKLGHHISNVGREFAPIAQKARADYHLFMSVPHGGIDTAGDVANVDWWAEQLMPAKIIWRTYNSLEGDWTLYPSNQEIVARWAAQNRSQYIRDDPVNEPSISGLDKLGHERYVARTVDLLNRAADKGIQVAACAFSVGIPNENYIIDGTYDPLIKAINQGNHYMSVHLYGTGFLEAGETSAYEILLDPKNLMNHYKKKWPFGKSYKYWLLRRPDFFAHRAEDIGEKAPRMLVTELFIDNIPDARRVLDPLDKIYGKPEYNHNLRGMLSYENYWKEAFPELDLGEAVDFLATHLVEDVLYPPFYEGGILFAAHTGWRFPAGSDYSDPRMHKFNTEYLPTLNRKPKEATMIRFPERSDIKWERGTLSGAKGKNARNQPSTSAIKVLPNGFTQDVHENIERYPVPNRSDGYDWYAFYINGMELWVANTAGLVWTPFVEEAPPIEEGDKEYLLDLLGMTIVMTESEKTKIRAIIARILEGIDQATLKS